MERIGAEVRVARRCPFPDRLEGDAAERPHPADGRRPEGRRPDRGHPLDASRQPHWPVPPRAFARATRHRTSRTLAAPPANRRARNVPEMNRGISAVHGLRDAPPRFAPFLRMSHGGLLAEAVRRQSGCRSCRSGPAPAVARSRRTTRRRHLAPLRTDASRPDARTGQNPFLRPREPTPIRPLGRSALRRTNRQVLPR